MAQKQAKQQRPSTAMRVAQQVVMLLTCLLVLAAAAINRDGRLLGSDASQWFTPAAPADSTAAEVPADTVTYTDSGMMVVHTALLAGDVSGYAGPVPLDVYVMDGKIDHVEALENSETPRFFDRASALLTQWNGKTLDEVATMQVDAVTGATYSSTAIITNVQRAAQYAGSVAATSGPSIPLKTWLALIVALAGALVPLFYHSRGYRIVQLIANVVVLGFWCGAFLSWELMVGYMANGFNWLTALPVVVMLVAAFIFPLFGRYNHYCNHICPFGSLQELAGMCSHRKVKVSARVNHWLTRFRQWLWVVLVALMVGGIWSKWTSYELFTAFAFDTASWIVIALAVLTVIVAVFIPRPYCRWICPTGTLFKVSQNTER